MSDADRFGQVEADASTSGVVSWSAALHDLAARHGEAVAITDGRATLDYRSLDAWAHALARSLLAKPRTEQGSAVASLLPNGLSAVGASYALKVMGAAEVPLSWGYTDEEIAWCARLAGFRIVVTLKERASALEALGLEPLAVDIDEALRAAIAEPRDRSPHRLALPPVPAHLPGRIMFTSGTTGRPKAVVYSHGSRWLGEQMLKATLPFVPAPGERLLLMTPFPHGASLLTYAWCDLGGTVLLLDGVDPQRVLPLLREAALAAVFAPPTVLAKLLNAAKPDEYFEGVRCVFTGTQPLTSGLYRKARAAFGPVVRITYGKTECVNPITVLAPAEVDALLGCDSAEVDSASPSEEAGPGACVGWPAPGVEIAIGHPVAAPRAASAQAGPERAGAAQTETIDDDAADDEVWLRARHMSDAIVDLEGAHPHEPQGWHRTGDLGRIDARGRLWLTGRVADVIKTGGYRVNPDEIESALAALPGCGAISVCSLPSEYWGEIIVAVAEGVRPGDASWRSEGEQRVASLSRHKRPRLWLAVDALPRNPQGKVNRRNVRALLLASHELRDGPYPELLPRGRVT